MPARRSTVRVRRPLVVPALALLTALVVSCATPSDPTGQPPATDPSGPPSASSASAAPLSEPPPGASYFLRVEPASAGDELTITLLNEFVEPAASAIPSGDPMEASGTLAPGTYTLEAGGATCEGELQLTHGVEVDAIVRIDAGQATCAVEPVGSHAPGQSHQFRPR